MTWFYNSHSGLIVNESGILALPYQAWIHAGIGWHELHIPSSASLQQAEAEALREVPGGASPTTSTAGAIGGIAGSTAGALAKGALTAVGDPVKAATKWLSQQALWTRIAEVGAGLIIMYVGLKAITAPTDAAAKQAGAQTVKSARRRVHDIKITHASYKAGKKKAAEKAAKEAAKTAAKGGSP